MKSFYIEGMIKQRRYAGCMLENGLIAINAGGWLIWCMSEDEFTSKCEEFCLLPTMHPFTLPFFLLERFEDISGNTGTGIVAHGFWLPTTVETFVLDEWEEKEPGEGFACCTFYPSELGRSPYGYATIKLLKALHEHHGRGRIIFQPHAT